MEDKEKTFLKQIYKISLKNTLNLQEQNLYFMTLTAVFIVMSFAYGMYRVLGGYYLSSVFAFIASIFGYVLLTRIIKNSRSLTKEAYELKNDFIDAYPELQDEDLKEIHSKINPLDTIGRARKDA
ncbi:MAG TPA: hypothetical protein VHT96_12425 [Clostridia bacterium]|nr:hypothetical protein [Clostridia bacterium]